MKILSTWRNCTNLFELINGETIPLSQYSIDTSNDKFNYARIIDFLSPFCNKDYLIEIVIDI